MPLLTRNMNLIAGAGWFSVVAQEITSMVGSIFGDVSKFGWKFEISLKIMLFVFIDSFQVCTFPAWLGRIRLYMTYVSWFFYDNYQMTKSKSENFTNPVCGSVRGSLFLYPSNTRILFEKPKLCHWFLETCNIKAEEGKILFCRWVWMSINTCYRHTNFIRVRKKC